MDNDVEMMNILFDIGCDPNYNGTAVNFMDAMEYFDYDSDEYLYEDNYNDYDYYYEYEEYDYEYDDDDLYVTGITILHLACGEGAIGLISKTPLFNNKLTFNNNVLCQTQSNFW